MAKNTHIYFTEYRLSLLVIDWNMSYGVMNMGGENMVNI